MRPARFKMLFEIGEYACTDEDVIGCMRQPNWNGLHEVLNAERGLKTATTSGIISMHSAVAGFSPRLSAYSLSLLGDLPARFAGEVFSLGNQVERFVQLWIAFEKDPAGISHTKAVVIDFVLDGALDVVAIVLEILFRELNSPFRDVLLELLDHCVRNLEADASIVGFFARKSRTNV